MMEGWTDNSSNCYIRLTDREKTLLFLPEPMKQRHFSSIFDFTPLRTGRTELRFKEAVGRVISVKCQPVK